MWTLPCRATVAGLRKATNDTMDMRCSHTLTVSSIQPSCPCKPSSHNYFPFITQSCSYQCPLPNWPTQTGFSSSLSSSKIFITTSEEGRSCALLQTSLPCFWTCLYGPSLQCVGTELCFSNTAFLKQLSTLANGCRAMGLSHSRKNRLWMSSGLWKCDLG